MSRYRTIAGFLILLISCFWLSPLQAQSEVCPRESVEMAYGDHSDGLITQADYFNHFCFEGHAGDRVVITAKLQTAEDDTRILMVLTSFRLEDIKDHTKSNDDFAQIIYTFEEDGYYLISMTLIDEEGEIAEGSYIISLDQQSRANLLEARTDVAKDVGACPGDHYIVIPGYEIEFNITDDSFFQYYCLVGKANHLYRLQAEAIQGNLDPILMVFDVHDTSEQVGNNDNISGFTNMAQMDVLPQKDGLYGVIVSRADVDVGKTVGRYRLTIEDRTTDTSAGCPSSSMISQGTEIEADDDEFYGFCINGTADQPLTLTATAQRGTLRVNIVVQDSDGNEVANERGSSETLEMHFTPPEDGIYFVYVFDYSGRGAIHLSLQNS